MTRVVGYERDAKVIARMPPERLGVWSPKHRGYEVLRPAKPGRLRRLSDTQAAEVVAAHKEYLRLRAELKKVHPRTLARNYGVSLTTIKAYINAAGAPRLEAEQC